MKERMVKAFYELPDGSFKLTKENPEEAKWMLYKEAVRKLRDLEGELGLASDGIREKYYELVKLIEKELN